MKIIIAIAIIVSIFSANAAIQGFLKGGLISDLTDYPASFGWTANTTTPYGAPANVTLRIDGLNNIFSYTLQYMSIELRRAVNETTAYDLNTNRTFIHNSGSDQCYRANLTANFTVHNVAQIVNTAWANNASIIDERWDGSNQIRTISINYNAFNKMLMTTTNDTFTSLNGTFGGAWFNQHITSGYYAKKFSLAEHIPRACL